MSFGPASPDAGVELLRQLFLQCVVVFLNMMLFVSIHISMHLKLALNAPVNRDIINLGKFDRFFSKVGSNYDFKTVLRIRIRIRKDPKLLAGSGSDREPK